jgi:hypothetical protein
MSELLAVELSDAELAAVNEAAAAEGKTPGEWAAARLREQLPTAVASGTRDAIAPEIHDLLQQVAARTGRSFETVTAAWIRDLAPGPRPALPPEEYEAADERLRQQTIDLGCATGAENERIDADLAREYGTDHACLYQPDKERPSS